MTSKKLVSYNPHAAAGSKLPQAIQDEIGTLHGIPYSKWSERHPGQVDPQGYITFYDKVDTSFALMPATVDTGQGFHVNTQGQVKNQPIIRDGAFTMPRDGSTTTNICYAVMAAGAQMTRIGIAFELDNSVASGTDWAIGLALMNNANVFQDTNSRIGVHISLDTNGIGVSKVDNGTGSPLFYLLDDTDTLGIAPVYSKKTLQPFTRYELQIYTFGNNAVICMPDGQVASYVCSDIPTWTGQWGFFEPVIANQTTTMGVRILEAWFGTETTYKSTSFAGGVVRRDDVDAAINYWATNNNATPAAIWYKDINLTNQMEIYDNKFALFNHLDNTKAAVFGLSVLSAVRSYTLPDFTGTLQMALSVTAVKTSAYTAGTNEIIPVDTTSAGVTITLPSAPPEGARVVVKKVDATTNTVTIARGGSSVFNVAAGSTSLSLTVQNQAVQLQYKASTAIWYVISTDVPLSALVTPTGTVALTNKDLTSGTNTFPTLNQNTTGSAAKLTTARTIDGVSFDGTANIAFGNVYPASLGWIGWAFDPMMLFAGAAPAAGFLYGVGVYIPKATSITNLVLNVMTAGATLTSGQSIASLYQGGALLGVTADQSTAWTSTGLKTMALTGGPIAVTAGWAYVCYHSQGTTRPTFSAAVAGSGTGTISVTNNGTVKRSFIETSHTGLTTTPPSTLGTLTDSSPVWAAVS